MTYKAHIERASAIGDKEEPIDGAEAVEIELEGGTTLTEWVIEFDHIDDILDAVDSGIVLERGEDIRPTIARELDDIDYTITIYDYYIE